MRPTAQQRDRTLDEARKGKGKRDGQRRHVQWANVGAGAGAGAGRGGCGQRQEGEMEGRGKKSLAAFG